MLADRLKALLEPLPIVGPQLLPMDFGRGSLGGRRQIRTYLP